MISILALRAKQTALLEILKLCLAKNVIKVSRVVFIWEALIVLGNISKVVKIPSWKLVENLFEIALRWVAVFFHEVVSNAKGKAGDTRLPVDISDVEWEVSSRVERKSRENLSISLLLVNILSVDEVTKNIANILHFFPNLF